MMTVCVNGPITFIDNPEREAHSSISLDGSECEYEQNFVYIKV